MQQNDETRIPMVVEGPGTYVWRNQPVFGPGVGVTVFHTKDTPVFTIGFLDEELKIPVVQAQWLAEVLLSVTDRYRERYEEAYGSDPGADDEPPATKNG